MYIFKWKLKIFLNGSVFFPYEEKWILKICKILNENSFKNNFYIGEYICLLWKNEFYIIVDNKLNIIIIFVIIIKLGENVN